MTLMARTLLLLTVLLAAGCATSEKNKSSVTTRITAEDQVTTSYKPSVKVKAEVEFKREF